jgi:elongation factor P
MASTADFKMGLCLEFNNDLYQIIDFQHVKPGKGPAFVRTKLKSLNSGKIIDHTFNAGVKVNTARVETRDYQYLYKEEFGYCFMNTETFEQVTIQENLVDGAEFLKEGQEAQIMFHAETETPLSCVLPPFVVLQITYSETGLKGDTATNTLKPATLETGATVNVPIFVNEGDLIKIDTRTRSYVERVKK